ncbi:MAG: hypothetical protein OK422_02100 [Thaumarchaeota archaeon]|nr:hypothetical protein [Nitrososphaerota archaeon]
MNRLRVGKYAVKTAYIVVWIVITAAIAGPLLGFLTPRISPQSVVGFGVDIQKIGPQLTKVFSDSSTLTQPHQINIPVYNWWIFPASASFTLKIIANGIVVYQTPTSSLSLGAFQSGKLTVPFQLSQSVVSQLSGKNITVGGSLVLGDPSYLWTLTVNFP